MITKMKRSDEGPMNNITIIPKKIEKYGHYFNYRQLTATAIMNVLKLNFPNDFIPAVCQTFVYINKKSTMPDHFAKPGRDSGNNSLVRTRFEHCYVEVVAISMGSSNDNYQLITPAEITMLFNCGTLYIKVDKSERTMNKSNYTAVIINNDVVHSENGNFDYYKSIVTFDNITAKELRERKANSSFKVVLNNDHP